MKIFFRSPVFFKILVVGAISIIGTACSSQSDSKFATEGKAVAEGNVATEGKPVNNSNINDPENCARQGGTLELAGLLQKPTCVIPYSDGGTDCKDSKDCAGLCLIYDTEIKSGDATTGQCQQNTLPFGCYAEVSGGIAGPFLCVD